MTTKHGQRHSISWLSNELNVDRKTLTPRLLAAGNDSGERFTIREAFKAWTAKGELEASRNRKASAEDDLAELTLAEKNGEIRDWMKRKTIDFVVRVRRTLEQAEYIPMESRIRLSHDIADMQEYEKRLKSRRSEIR